MLRIVFALLLALAVACPGTGLAAQLPEHINWSPNLFTVAAQRSTVTDSVKQQVAEMITRRLHVLRDSGKLPFTLKEYNAEYNIQKSSADGEIGLVALLVDNSAFDSQYAVSSATYYKLTMLCGIDLMFCSVDEETNSMRILHTIPLRGYDVLGGDLQHLVTSPITPAQQQAMFLSIARKLIGELDFTATQRELKKLQLRQVLPETYQVTEVAISSRKANEVFAGQTEAVKSLLGGVYTSKFQQTRRCIMYPARTGSSWQHDASRNLYSLQMVCPSSALTVTMPEPQYTIKLDVTGVASGEIPTKNPSAVKIDMGYKAWLKATNDFGQPPLELDRFVMRQYSKQNTIHFDVDDIYTELLIGLASDLARKK